MNARLKIYDRVIRQVAKEADFEIVELRIPQSRKIILTVDRESGLGVDELSYLHRKVMSGLEDEGFSCNLIHIEVQSPGLDRKLTRDKDFERFSGNVVKVILNRKWNGRVKLTGVLMGLRQSGSQIAMKERRMGEVEVDRDRIKECRLVPKYDL